MKALEIHVDNSSDRISVRLAGEFDISGVRDFHRVLARVQEEAPEGICIDLRELTFMGATGVRALLDLQARARRDGFELTVVKGPRLVQRVFEMTGVDRRLALVDEP
ncbi:MAG: STAS domain-containing protein [Thermoleophilaceae bacterium]